MATPRTKKPSATPAKTNRSLAPSAPASDDAREWLAANGYTDVVELINEVLAEWKAAGLRTRRNWWDVLAGGFNGRPKTVSGRVFPVLAVAQMRKGLAVTPNARAAGKAVAPAPQTTGRWPRKKRSRRTK